MHKGVICGICGQWLEIITYTHIRKHGLTQREYLERFPEHCYLRLWPEAPDHWRDNKYARMREEIMGVNHCKSRR